MISQDGTIWSRINSSIISKKSLLSVTFAKGIFVAVGDGGIILQSTNGTTWTEMGSATTYLLNAVCHGGDYFMAVGRSGTILVWNTDYSLQPSAGNTKEFYSLTYGRNHFIASNTTGIVLITPNSLNNALTKLGDAYGVMALTYGNGIFVATTGDGTIYKSIEIPVLISPFTESINLSTTPTLNWKPINGVTAYQVQVARDSNFNSIVFDVNNITSTKQVIFPSLVNNSKYYWHVKAANGGTYDYSETWCFTTGSSSNINSQIIGNSFFSFSGTPEHMQYILPVQCNVSINYYNFSGKLVASFVIGIQNPGRYSLKLPFSSLAKGNYIQFFKAGSFTHNSIVTVK